MFTKIVNLKKEDFDIYIGRGSKWGNPFKINKNCTREQSLSLYLEYIKKSPELLLSLEELRGKRLGCFCKPLACHGDILLYLLNEKELMEFF